MGNWTFAQMKSRLKLAASNQTALESPVNWYADFVNQSYLMLCTSKTLFGTKFKLWFPELETSSATTTVDGRAYVSVPSACWIVRGIWNSTDDQMLDWIPNETYWDKTGRATSTSEGTATKYTRRGTYIYLQPTPDDSTTSLTIYYKKRPDELTSETDVTEIDKVWDRPIVELAAIQMHYVVNEFEFAEKKKELFVQNLGGIAEAQYDEHKQLNGILSMSPLMRP